MPVCRRAGAGRARWLPGAEGVVYCAARAISAHNHPHICTLYDIGPQDGIGYLVGGVAERGVAGEVAG